MVITEFSEDSFDEADLDELEPGQARPFSETVEEKGASRVKFKAPKKRS